MTSSYLNIFSVLIIVCELSYPKVMNYFVIINELPIKIIRCDVVPQRIVYGSLGVSPLHEPVDDGSTSGIASDVERCANHVEYSVEGVE